MVTRGNGRLCRFWVDVEDGGQVIAGKINLCEQRCLATKSNRARNRRFT
jgi:hypothetical protein